MILEIENNKKSEEFINSQVARPLRRSQIKNILLNSSTKKEKKSIKKVTKCINISDEEVAEYIVENPNEIILSTPIISTIAMDETLPFFKSITYKLSHT